MCLQAAAITCSTCSMTEADGFLVQSRWGMKLHKAGCPCGVCKSKRKAACDSLQPDSPSELPVPHESSNLQGSSAATLDAAGSPKCNMQKQHQLRNGVRTAPAAMRTLRGQAALETAVKPAVKVRYLLKHGRHRKCIKLCHNRSVIRQQKVKS